MMVKRGRAPLKEKKKERRGMAPSIKKRVGEKNDQVVACRIRLYIKKNDQVVASRIRKRRKGEKRKK